MNHRPLLHGFLQADRIDLRKSWQIHLETLEYVSPSTHSLAASMKGSYKGGTPIPPPTNRAVFFADPAFSTIKPFPKRP